MIIYAAAAVEEVAEILTALQASSVIAAEKFQTRLWEIELQLETYPSSGAATSARGASIRRMVLRPYPYVLFYRVESDDIVILGVRHGARDPMTMPDTRASR